jgi:hypothetical protein
MSFQAEGGREEDGRETILRGREITRAEVRVCRTNRIDFSQDQNTLGV